MAKTNDPFAINTDNRADIPAAKKKAGFLATQEPHEYINQALFESVTKHVWGTQAQALTDDATFYTDSSGNPFDKNNVAVPIVDDDVILMTHNATLAANLLLQPSPAARVHVDMLKGVEINPGDAGSGEPFKIIIGTDVSKGSTVKIRGPLEFIDIPFALTDDQKRFIANQAVGVRVQYNEDVIHDPSRVGDIVTKTSFPANPYLIRANGQQLNYRIHQTVPATNDTLAWFRDLNKYENGFRDGNEVASRHTLPAVISASPHRFQVNTPTGMLRDISTVDPDIHDRTDANGVSIAATVDFDGSSTVLFQGSVGDAKNFMRIQSTSIPGGSSATTLLTDIDEGALTATMIDALTLAPVSVGTATEAATIDNSGAAGGSLQDDATQGHWHNVKDFAGITDFWTPTSGVNTSAKYYAADDAAKGDQSDRIIAIAALTDGVNGTPRIKSVTRDNSTDIYIFYQG